MTERALQWETVPRDTKASICRARECGKTIYFIERPRKGKPGMARVPVDCDVEGGVTPDSFSDGRGVNHFQTCCAHEDF